MRNTIETQIRQYKMPRSTVAKLSGLHLTTLSGWLNGRFEIDESKIARIEQTVKRLATLVDLAAFPIDLKNIPAIGNALAAFENAFAASDREFDSFSEGEKAEIRKLILDGILAEAKAKRVLAAVSQ